MSDVFCLQDASERRQEDEGDIMEADELDDIMDPDDPQGMSNLYRNSAASN